MRSEFRQTEYGKVDASYSKNRLADICVKKGGVQTGPFGSQLHQEDYVDVGTPIITVEHLGDNRLLHDNMPSVTDKDKDRLSKYHLETGDVVFSRVGSVDRRALVRDEEDGWLFSGRCLRVRANKEIIDPVYLSYYFGLETFKNYIRSIAVGATMPSINTKILSDVPIYYPNLDRQKEIANILYSIDERIELNRQINQTLEQIAQAIFKSWFVDFDPVKAKILAKEQGCDPERAAMEAIAGKSISQFTPTDQLAATAALFPDELVESELGLIPKGWEASKLGNVAENHSTTFDFSKYENVVFINTGDVAEGVFLHKNYSSKNALPGQAKKSIKRDDILFSEIRPKNKRFAYVNFIPDEYVVSTKFMIIRSLGEVHPRYLYQILKQNHTISEFNYIAESRSGTFPQITYDSINYFPVVVPCKEIQAEFMGFLQPIIDKQENLLKQKNTLSALRDFLLPKLLSGLIDLKEAKLEPESRKLSAKVS